jgi:hypothetical protein
MWDISHRDTEIKVDKECEFRCEGVFYLNETEFAWVQIYWYAEATKCPTLEILSLLRQESSMKASEMRILIQRSKDRKNGTENTSGFSKI